MTPSPFAASTLIGESFAGSGPNAAHLNVVIGRKGGPVETAWMTSLATPRAGHVPFLVTLRPNLPVKPATLFVNKADVRGERHEALTWGAAQAGVAAGIAQAVAEGLIPSEDVDDLVVIAAGSPPGIPGSTNALRVHRIGDAKNRVAPAYEDLGTE